MQSMLNSPITTLGLSAEDAGKLSEALNVRTVRELATNQHFLLAQNAYLLAEANVRPDTSEKKHPLLELISSIAGATVLFAALLYAAGWSYLYQYYKSFGIRVSELNLPVNDALIYSLAVIFKDRWSVVGLVLLVLIVSAVLTIRWISKKLLTPIAVGLFLVLVPALGLLLSQRGVQLGKTHALEDMKEESANLPNVRLNLKSESPASDGAKKEQTSGQQGANDSNENPEVGPGVKEKDFAQQGFRLLIHANQQYYLFQPLKNVPSQPTGNLDIYVVPDSRVRSIYIQRGIS